MLDDYFSAFAAYLLRGETRGLAPYCERADAKDVLEVYRNGFFKACVDALGSNFPAVRRLVGETYFAALARAYVEAHPPCRPTLVEYGDDFPGFIDRLRDAHALSYLSDVASLDAAWLGVYFAEDLDTIDGAGVTALGESGADIDALCLQLAPTVRFCTLGHRVLEVWAKLRLGPLEQRVQLDNVVQHVLLWRDGSSVRFRALGLAEFHFAAAISTGETLGEAASRAVGIDPGFEIAGTFASLLENRMLVLDSEKSTTTKRKRNRCHWSIR